MAHERSEFATYLRSLRKQREMTLRDVGDAAKIDFTYLSKIENDQVPAPPVDTVLQLAAALRATRAEYVRLMGTAEGRREATGSSGAGKVPEEALLLRRISSGGYTRAQLRQMLQMAETLEKPGR